MWIMLQTCVIKASLDSTTLVDLGRLLNSSLFTTMIGALLIITDEDRLSVYSLLAIK